MKSPTARIPPLRRWLHAARKQGLLVRSLILSVYLPITLIYAVLALSSGRLLALLIRDPNSMADTGLFYQGALSHLGVLLWWAASVISAFASVLIGRAPHKGRRGTRAFFLYLAILTGFLALDDLFMLHEEVFPNYLGIPESVVYAGYGVLALGFTRFLPVIYRTPFALLALGFGFFLFSVLSDFGMLRVLFGLSGGVSLALEDLSKALGIVSWFAYALSAGLQEVRRHLDAPLPEQAVAVREYSVPSVQLTLAKVLQPLRKSH